MACSTLFLLVIEQIAAQSRRNFGLVITASVTASERSGDSTNCEQLLVVT
jgi:hypothetical protein